MVKEKLISFGKFLIRPPVKAGVLALVAIAEGFAASWLFSWTPDESLSWVKTVGFVACLIVAVAIPAAYTTVEVNQRRTIEELQNQVRALEELATRFISICQTNVEDINNCIQVVSETHQINTKIWSFERCAKSICTQIYQHICTLGGPKRSDKYEVSYVILDEQSGANDMVKMIAYATRIEHKPTIYKVPRSFKNADVTKDYFDLQLFNVPTTENTILMGSSEVNQHFVYPAGRRANEPKYHLFIGVPVFCDSKNGTRMVGLLEVVGLDNSILGCKPCLSLSFEFAQFIAPYPAAWLWFNV